MILGIKRFFLFCWPGILLGVVVLLICHPYITNAFTPYGDGNRILPYLRFANAVPEIFPLWNPFRLFGVPVLADPENFVWLSWLLDSSSAWVNLHVNLLFLFLIWCISFTVFLLARRVGVSRLGAFIGGLAMVVSTYILTWLAHGRLNVLMSFVATNLSLLCYVVYFRKKKKVWFLASAFFVGFNISRIVQYSAPNLFFPLAVLSLFFNVREKGWGKGLWATACHVVLLGLIGIAAFSYSLLPLVAYQLGQLSSHAMHLRPVFSPISGLRDILYPFDVHEHRFVFVGYFFAPLLMAILARRHLAVRTVLLPFFGIFIFSLFFLCGEVYPFRLYYDMLAMTPLLTHLRHTQVFSYPLSLSAAMLCAMGYDLYVREDFSLLPLLLGGGLLCGVVIVFSLGVEGESLFHNLPGLIFIFASCLAAGMCGRKVQAKKILMCVLVVCTVGARAMEFPQEVRAVDNKIDKRWQPLIEDDGYYRIFNHRGKSRLGNKAELSEFSLYFSSEQRVLLHSLFGKPTDEYSRPHHYLSARETLKSIPDVSLLRLMNVKYVTYPTGQKFRRLLKEVGYSPLGKNIWVAKNFEPSLKVFNRWMIVPDTRMTLSSVAEKLGVSPYDVLLLSEDAESAVSQWLKENAAESADINVVPDNRSALVAMSANRMVIHVETTQPGVLFIPEVYDAGWSATVDGIKAPVVRAHMGLRGVPVGAGNHLVCLSYVPPMFLVGLVLAGCYWALLLWFAWCDGFYTVGGHPEISSVRKP